MQLLIVFFINLCVPVLKIFFFCVWKTFHIFKSYRDKDFARLAQLIVDYENPLKKLVEDYAPHNRVNQFSFIYCQWLCIFISSLFLCSSRFRLLLCRSSKFILSVTWEQMNGDLLISLTLFLYLHKCLIHHKLIR